MHSLAILISALSLVAAAPANDVVVRQNIVASADRFASSGCTGTICNKAGAGDLRQGCNVITDSCKASLKLTGLNPGCKMTIWTDSNCSNNNQFANVTSFECFELGPPIGSISVTC